MINREDILKECVDRMLNEMYKWAQPSLDLKEFLKKAKDRGWTDNNKDPLYTHHYLSEPNFTFIRKAYLDAYGIFDWWSESIDTLVENFKEGGYKDIWIPAKGNMGDENWRPGYRDSVKVDPLYKLIGKGNADIVLQTIDDYKNFYKFGGRDLNRVSVTVTLGFSPTSNKESVEKYWSKRGEPIKIKDFSVEKEIYGDECN